MKKCAFTRLLAATTAATISVATIAPDITAVAATTRMTQQRKLPSFETTGIGDTTADDSTLDLLETDDSNTTADADDNGEEELSDIQRQSINMLNYMTDLTQEINDGRQNRVLLDEKYTSLVNDMYPNAVDTKTESQITSLLDTINSYRMVDIKRERLEYIYEQNKAQALRSAMPNPLGLLSAVQSGSLMKSMISIIYMAADSASSYKTATTNAELQYLKDGWELDDEESEELHNSTKKQLSYMFQMCRNYDLEGDYAINQEAVQDFTEWTAKPDSQIVSKISWLESHENTYEMFGMYWLELAKDYFTAGDYDKCLEAVERYEAITMRIFRKDVDYAQVLPMAIYSAKEAKSERSYISDAERYCQAIMKNTKDGDWSLRYFVAQTYTDLYGLTGDEAYLEKAYTVAYDNVVNLYSEQAELNDEYLDEVKKAEVPSGATKQQEKEVKAYNKMMKEQRKTELPPVSEPLYLNVKLLYALVDELDKPSSEKQKIDAVLHPEDGALFLAYSLDDEYWFNNPDDSYSVDDLTATFDGEKLVLPLSAVSGQYHIKAEIVSGDQTTVLDDFETKSVKRPDKKEYADYTAEFTSTTGKKYKYGVGDEVTFTITPFSTSSEDAESDDYSYSLTFDVAKKDGFHPINDLKFVKQ